VCALTGWEAGTRSERTFTSRLSHLSLKRDFSTQYTYLMSRTCDRLAEIFQRAGPSAVPEHAVNVFLLVDRFERFDGVDIASLGADNGYIPDEELKKVVRCLKLRSASLLGC